MTDILVLHGPNLNLLGAREPQVYGYETLQDVDAALQEFAAAHGAHLRILQSNHEGQLIDAIHEARAWAAGILINPGAFTHYSYALRDAIDLVGLPTVEIHLSQTAAREEFRQRSVVSPVVDVTITGAGPYGYELAVLAARHLVGSRRGGG